MVDDLIIQFLTCISRTIDMDKVDIYGKALGTLLWDFLENRRYEAILSVQKHLQVEENLARSIAKESFINTGKAFFESFVVQNFDFKYIKHKVKINNFRYLQDIGILNRPIVIVTAHLGAWEMLLAILKVFLPDKSTQVVVKFPKNRLLKKLLERVRTGRNVQILGHRQAVASLLPHLRKNGLAAFLVDHNALSKEAIFLPFLGEIAAVNMGPALIAVRTKALVWPVFALRQERNIHLILQKPCDPDKIQGSIKEKVRKVAEFYTKAVEDMVLTYPEQWYWIHRRWKTRPDFTY
ncbi:MAG: lysophospholipid acyltransferase family protein [Desulfonauticus sp.]|nr:lysophospholipid acyltransferase family protein [Desulfonauticus sp.]